MAGAAGLVRVGRVTQWFTESFRAEFERQADQIGRINLAVFGKTGVGKSTLVNAIFGEPVAVTGIGAPVTIGSHLFLDKRGALGVVDTRGLELGHDDDQIIKELTKAIKESRSKPVSEQIHVAWYCIRGMDRRFEDFEERFIRTLDSLGLPVLVVLTQVPMRDGMYHPDAVELARQIEAKGLPIVGGRRVGLDTAATVDGVTATAAGLLSTPTVVKVDVRWSDRGPMAGGWTSVGTAFHDGHELPIGRGGMTVDGIETLSLVAGTEDASGHWKVVISEVIGNGNEVIGSSPGDGTVRLEGPWVLEFDVPRG